MLDAHIYGQEGRRELDAEYLVWFMQHEMNNSNN